MVGQIKIKYSEVLQELEYGTTESHRNKAENEIKGLFFHVSQILHIHKTLCEITMLEKKDHWVPANRRKSILRQYEAHAKACNNMAQKLTTLSVDDVEFLSLIYEKRLSHRAVAEIISCSEADVIEKKNHILDKLSDNL